MEPKIESCWEFEEKLLEILKTNGKGNFKRKTWANYPKSTFYYYDDDDKMQSEIAIFTEGIYENIYTLNIK